MGYLEGFGITLSKWAGTRSDSGRRVTTEYPEEVRPKPERFHGRHVLNRYDDGMEKCIGCELCAGVCPARCIYVRGADNDPDDPTSPGERYGFIYEINYLRCIHCDLCVEACPTEAITETKLFEFAFTNRADAIYTKDELVVDDDGRPQQLPWENWSGGFDPAADTSGWMRATSPSGDENFVDVVAWAGELGYGVRAPQGGGTVEVEVAEPLAPAPEPEPEPASVEPVPVEVPDEPAPGTFDAGPSDTTVIEQPDADESEPGPEARQSDPELSPATFDAGPADLGPADTDNSVTKVDEDEAPDVATPRGYFDAPEVPTPRRGSKSAAPPHAPAPDPPPQPETVPVPEREAEPAPEPDASPQVADELTSPDETDVAGDDSTPADDPTSPSRGFFDVPDEPEPDDGKRRWRRRGGR